MVRSLPKISSKILVDGSHADNLGTNVVARCSVGKASTGIKTPQEELFLVESNSAVDPSFEITYMEYPETEIFKSNNCSFVIVVVGEHPYTEMLGDSSNPMIPDPSLSIINIVCGQVKCVVIIISGNPVVMEPYMGVIDALVAAWLRGSVSKVWLTSFWRP